MLAALMAMVEALCSRAVVVGGSMPKNPQRQQAGVDGQNRPVVAVNALQHPLGEAAQGGQLVRITLFRCGAQDRLFHKEFLASSCRGR
mgnify:CR=1 FL=1